MDYAEIEAAAHADLRESILSEFLKPGRPAEVTLLVHCARYLTRILDAHVEGALYGHGLEWSRETIETVARNLVVFFFGCDYVAPETTRQLRRPFTRVSPGCPWGRCVEYVMIALVDHGVEPRPSEDEILGRYLDIRGHFFMRYALEPRVKFWGSKVRIPNDSADAVPMQLVSDVTPVTEDTAPRFPNRAVWLKAQITEREWTKYDFRRHDGPEHRTIQKILNGYMVQGDVISKVIRALRSKQTHKGQPLPPVIESDIPSD
jgi:hypothetical protein